MLNARSAAPRATMLLPIGQTSSSLSIHLFLSRLISLFIYHFLVLCLSFAARSSRYLWNLLDRAFAAFRFARSLRVLHVPALLVPGGLRGPRTFQSSLPSMPVRRTPCQIAARFCRGFSRPAPISRPTISLK